MISRSVDLVYKLQELYKGKGEYSQEMAKMIMKHWDNYQPYHLQTIFDIIASGYAGDFGPPALSTIIELVDKYNARTGVKDNIREKRKVKELPGPEERPAKPILGAVLRVAFNLWADKTISKKDKFAIFHKEAERIYNEH